jgi:NAD(P)-dependent dehydrogenase (short-subunit alcohol dehydrogenase family)
MLNGKRILVTAGRSRLGQILAEELEARGAEVVLTTRDPAAAAAFNSTAAATGRRARATCLGFIDAAEMREFARDLLARHGAVHGVVNNAYAALPYRALGEIPWSHWSESIQVGVAAVETLASALLAGQPPSVLTSIVSISSIYAAHAPKFAMYPPGREPSPLYYGATKAALLALTRYLAAAWAPRGVRVNAVSAGGIQSGQDAEFLARYAATVPATRMVETREVAAVVAFLLSDEASAVTGADYVVDAGRSAW